jgi:chromosome segregation ATPase
MAAKKAAAPTEEKPKRTRVVLSPAEKIAKLEADLEAARESQHEAEKKQIDKLLDRRSKLAEQISERESKVTDLDEQLQLLGYDESTPETEEV